MECDLRQIRRFRPGEVDTCGETGECCQCGAGCCITPGVIVPSVPGDVNSQLISKPPGEICPQLSIDIRRRAICLLHEEKEDPRLRICHEWIGNETTDEESITLFEHMCRATVEWLIAPTSAEEADRIALLLKKNAIPSKAIAHAKQAALAKPTQTLLAYFITCETLPAKIAETLDIPRVIIAAKPAVEAKLGRGTLSYDDLAFHFGLNPNSSLYETFMSLCPKAAAAPRPKDDALAAAD